MLPTRTGAQASGIRVVEAEALVVKIHSHSTGIVLKVSGYVAQRLDERFVRGPVVAASFDSTRLTRILKPTCLRNEYAHIHGPLLFAGSRRI